MLTTLILASSTQLVIAPEIFGSTISPALHDFQRMRAEPIAWTCKSLSASGEALTISGRFAAPVKSGNQIVRPITFRATQPIDISGSGMADWGPTEKWIGYFRFQMEGSVHVYDVEMNFIQPGRKGHIRVWSGDKPLAGKPPEWALEAVGVCETTAETSAEKSS